MEVILRLLVRVNEWCERGIGPVWRGCAQNSDCRMNWPTQDGENGANWVWLIETSRRIQFNATYEWRWWLIVFQMFFGGWFRTKSKKQTRVLHFHKQIKACISIRQNGNWKIQPPLLCDADKIAFIELFLLFNYICPGLAGWSMLIFILHLIYYLTYLDFFYFWHSTELGLKLLAQN